jgi:hypothetical protein
MECARNFNNCPPPPFAGAAREAFVFINLNAQKCAETIHKTRIHINIQRLAAESKKFCSRGLISKADKNGARIGSDGSRSKAWAWPQAATEFIQKSHTCLVC